MLRDRAVEPFTVESTRPEPSINCAILVQYCLAHVLGVGKHQVTRGNQMSIRIREGCTY